MANSSLFIAHPLDTPLYSSQCSPYRMSTVQDYDDFDQYLSPESEMDDKTPTNTHSPSPSMLEGPPPTDNFLGQGQFDTQESYTSPFDDQYLHHSQSLDTNPGHWQLVTQGGSATLDAPLLDAPITPEEFLPQAFDPAPLPPKDHIQGLEVNFTARGAFIQTPSRGENPKLVKRLQSLRRFEWLDQRDEILGTRTVLSLDQPNTLAQNFPDILAQLEAAKPANPEPEDLETATNAFLHLSEKLPNEKKFPPGKPAYYEARILENDLKFFCRAGWFLVLQQQRTKGTTTRSKGFFKDLKDSLGFRKHADGLLLDSSEHAWVSDFTEEVKIAHSLRFPQPLGAITTYLTSSYY